MPEVTKNIKDTIFVDIEVKDLPEDVQKRHRARKRKLDKLFKQEEKIRAEGDRDIRDLIKGRK